ncbi:MAG: hypothetical protein K2Q01_08595 [Rickettsiales bacterium]|nr:hypothetical protein [Rickettsiales bacterium]
MLPLLSTAAAADSAEQQKKRAQKVIDALKNFGLADPNVKNLVHEASARMENGYFYAADYKMDEGRLSLRWQMRSNAATKAMTRGNPAAQKLHLSYVPEDSNYSVIASTRGIMLQYHYDFK